MTPIWPGCGDDLDVLTADRARTLAAAHIKAHYKVSFADAFVIALAPESAATVVTGDPELKAVEPWLPILWLPR